MNHPAFQVCLLICATLVVGCEHNSRSWTTVSDLGSAPGWQYGKAMTINSNGDIYVLTHHNKGAIKIDARTKEIHESTWLPDESLTTNEPHANVNDPGIDLELLRLYCHAALFETFLDEVDVRRIVKIIDSASDEERGILAEESCGASLVYPAWNLMKDDQKSTKVTDIIEDDLLNYLSQPTIEWTRSNGIFYGLLYMPDDMAHDFYHSRTGWPLGLLETINDSSHAPTLFFDGRIQGKHIVLTQLYTYDYFVGGGLNNHKLFASGSSHPFIIRNRELWILSNMAWKRSGSLPVDETGFYHVHEGFLYAYGRSAKDGNPAIFKKDLLGLTVE